MRPNFAQDAPPTEITVGGSNYPVNVDFRIWIEVLRLMRSIVPGTSEERPQQNAEAFEQMQTLVFGGILADEEPQAVVAAMVEFARGYPTAPMETDSESPTYSFDYDLNEIVIAIRNQSGIDLSYRRKEPFHWWEFLLEFRTLCGDHYILHLMDARGYKGNDKELRRRKSMCALPVEHTPEEQAVLDEFNEKFYNC